MSRRPHKALLAATATIAMLGMVGASTTAHGQATTRVRIVDVGLYQVPCDEDGSQLQVATLGIERLEGPAPGPVNIQLSGTAVAGVDYKPIDPTVMFVNNSLLAAFTPQHVELLPGATPGRTIVLEILPGDGYEVAEPSVGTMTIERVPCPTTTTTTAPPGVGFVGDAPSSDTEVLARTGSSTREAWLAGLGALLLAGGCALVALARKREAAR